MDHWLRQSSNIMMFSTVDNICKQQRNGLKTSSIEIHRTPQVSFWLFFLTVINIIFRNICIYTNGISFFPRIYGLLKFRCYPSAPSDLWPWPAGVSQGWVPVCAGRPHCPEGGWGWGLSSACESAAGTGTLWCCLVWHSIPYTPWCLGHTQHNTNSQYTLVASKGRIYIYSTKFLDYSLH